MIWKREKGKKKGVPEGRSRLFFYRADRTPVHLLRDLSINRDRSWDTEQI